MGLFSGMFGPSREENWQQVAANLGGTYTPRTFLRLDRVQVRTENGIVTLDLDQQSSGEHNTTYTRLRAPFVNRLGHRLKVYRSGFFSEIGKMLGTQDIELDDAGFDADFVVQGRSPEWVKAVLDPAARRLIQGNERFFLEIRPDNHLFGSRFPDGVELLVFSVPEVIKDPERLTSLFHLLDHLLRRIETVGLSHLEPAPRLIAVLEGPGGQVVEHGEALWEGTPPRCRAAAELGRLKEPRAVPALLRALHEPDADPGLCSMAVGALGEIGSPEAIPRLLPLLGIDPQLNEWGLSGRVAQALTMMGKKDLVATFRAGCEGRIDGVDPALPYRTSFIAAWLSVIEGSDPSATAGAAAALAHLGAVESLERLRQRLKKLDTLQSEARTALERAIDRLERASRLPRPASSPGVDAAALPRPASPDLSAGAGALPVPTHGAECTQLDRD